MRHGATPGSGIEIAPLLESDVRAGLRPALEKWQRVCPDREAQLEMEARRSIDFIKICFDFRTAFCVSAKFGSYAARNMFP